MSDETLRLLLIVALGLTLGSFLNVVIYRLPGGWRFFFASTRSRCRACKSSIYWYDNIPVVSFLVLKGRCRRCCQTISWQYPLMELLMGALTLVLYRQYGLFVYFYKYLVMVFLLLAAAVIDLQTRKIPDSLIYIGIGAGVLFAFLCPFPGWRQSLLSLGIGFLVPLVVVTLYELLRGKTMMGGGDIKLMAVIAVFLGWQRLGPMIIYSCLVGLLVALIFKGAGAKGSLPFAPSLATGTALVLWSPGWLYFFVTIH